MRQRVGMEAARETPCDDRAIAFLPSLICSNDLPSLTGSGWSRGRDPGAENRQECHSTGCVRHVLDEAHRLADAALANVASCSSPPDSTTLTLAPRRPCAKGWTRPARRSA
jgi:hypothetical protein